MATSGKVTSSHLHGTIVGATHFPCSSKRHRNFERDVFSRTLRTKVLAARFFEDLEKACSMFDQSLDHQSQPIVDLLLNLQNRSIKRLHGVSKDCNRR